MLKPLKDIVNECIDNNFGVFQAFDVTDGNMTPKEFYRKVREHHDSC